MLKKRQRIIFKKLKKTIKNKLNSSYHVPIEQLQAELLAESTLDLSYIILIISSCAIATLGLLSNSPAVIIGAMIIAPLMLPIRGLALGALEGDIPLFRQSWIAILVGSLTGIIISATIGLLVGLPTFGSEIMARSKPNLLDLGIAIFAGGISGYAKFQPKVSSSLAGTAIAVALMPPVCVIGLGLSHQNWYLSLGAALLFITNLLGIAFACILAFFLAGYTPFYRARKAIFGSFILTSLLVLPLSFGLVELIRQSRLRLSLEKALVDRTLTFQEVELLEVDVDWLSRPPQASLYVKSNKQITPKQVQLLENFVAKEMSQPFTLIFEVNQVTSVTSKTK